MILSRNRKPPVPRYGSSRPCLFWSLVRTRENRNEENVNLSLRPLLDVLFCSSSNLSRTPSISTSLSCSVLWCQLRFLLGKLLQTLATYYRLTIFCGLQLNPMSSHRHSTLGDNVLSGIRCRPLKCYHSSGNMEKHMAAFASVSITL